VLSESSRIRAEFEFLTSRGYEVAVESDVGMAGTVAYRSPLLWIVFEWDRSDPWLSFTLTGMPPNSISWRAIEYLLNGASAAEHDSLTSAFADCAGAPVERLGAFVRANLDELERRLVPPYRAEIVEQLRTMQANMRQQ
jgi:hypothetical protein